eukprot:FR740236.1.p1 GENE.FR740236.1~~FR740236.1.p1  ORF type:complete len:190 (+),score=24.01 FR740236.1:3-572(+)
MMIGEEVELIAQPGELIPDYGTTIKAQLKLVSIKSPPDTMKMAIPERIALSDELRGVGNELFKAGDYARALRRYQLAERAVIYDFVMSDDEKATCRPPLIRALVNEAVCYLKMGKPELALTTCDDAIQKKGAGPGMEAKATLRRGQALVALDRLDEAKLALEKASVMDPVVKAEANNELKRIPEEKLSA